jgi:hypothetical protein
MKKFLNEGNLIHNFISSSGSETVISYGSGSGSDFLTSSGSDFLTSSGSTSQKVTVLTVPVPQHCNICFTLPPHGEFVNERFTLPPSGEFVN